MALVLVFASPLRLLRAEDGITYKYQYWQEDNERIKVEAHYALAETTLGVATTLKLMGALDTISGATPTGKPAPAGSDQVPLAELDDVRRAGSLEVTHQFPRISLAGTFARSVESDYLSNTFALNTRTDFNRKLTTLLVGFARANDDITARPLPEPATKGTSDFIVGLTQVVDANTTFTANLTYSSARGYLSDPYKLVEQETEILPGLSLPLTFAENRPQERSRGILYLAVNHNFERLRGALDLVARGIVDDYGTDSGMLELKWFQRLGATVILSPSLRLYQQKAADFYYVTLTDTAIVANSEPTGIGPYYSSDYRLSEMRTFDLGLKVIWQVQDRLAVDAAYNRYLMAGRDGITPDSAYAEANVFSMGARWSF